MASEVANVGQVFEAERRRLFSLAYRLLGSATDAEDVLQTAFERWMAADTIVAEPRAWLTTVVTNLCMKQLGSARRRREVSGTWLPEPVVTSGGELGPLETAEQRELVSFGVLILLEKLSPAERAVFVLREAFGYGYAELAQVPAAQKQAAGSCIGAQFAASICRVHRVVSSLMRRAGGS